MIPFAIPMLVKSWWKLALGFVLGAVMCFPLAQCRGEKIGRLRMEAAIARANVETLQQKARADELAANQRIIDTVAVNRQEQELLHAIAQTPDSLPDASRIALGCARLRRAHGSSAAALPAECRSGSGAEARPAR